MRGTIKTVFPDRAFAFIRGEDRLDYFFHRNVNPRFFDEAVGGDPVDFEGETTERGPRATRVVRA